MYPEVEVVFSPAVRWGTTVLPGQAITRDHLYAYLGFTYPELYLFYLRGSRSGTSWRTSPATSSPPTPSTSRAGT